MRARRKSSSSPAANRIRINASVPTPRVISGNWSALIQCSPGPSAIPQSSRTATSGTRVRCEKRLARYASTSNPPRRPKKFASVIDIGFCHALYPKSPMRSLRVTSSARCLILYRRHKEDGSSGIIVSQSGSCRITCRALHTSNVSPRVCALLDRGRARPIRYS